MFYCTDGDVLGDGTQARRVLYLLWNPRDLQFRGFIYFLRSLLTTLFTFISRENIHRHLAFHRGRRKQGRIPLVFLAGERRLNRPSPHSLCHVDVFTNKLLLTQEELRGAVDRIEGVLDTPHPQQPFTQGMCQASRPKSCDQHECHEIHSERRKTIWLGASLYP